MGLWDFLAHIKYHVEDEGVEDTADVPDDDNSGPICIEGYYYGPDEFADDDGDADC